MKPAKFHPKALEFIRGQATELRTKIGEALRDVQKGISLALPLSRPMPSVAVGVHELRIKDDNAAVRVFYFVKLPEAVVIFHGFQKKTQKTPKREIEIGQKRLKEVLYGKI